MVETGTMVVHTAETQGSLFLASMAEGYLGEDKLKIGVPSHERITVTAS